MNDPALITTWLASWGYPAIFAAVFIGNLGIPVPEETVMLGAGFLAGRNVLDIRLVYAVVIASAVAGDCCGFLIGRTGGQRLLDNLAQRFTFMHSRYERLKEFFRSHGSKAVFMARFVTGARFMAGPMAGACHMPFLQFLGWNILGAIVWCSIVVTVGYLVGDEIYRAVAAANHLSHWMIAGAAVTGIFAFIWWRGRAPAVSPSDQ
jgi:membrane protein DedA with SNARE-associated domain